MKKKLFLTTMAIIITANFSPIFYTNAKASTNTNINETNHDDENISDDFDDEFSGEFTKYDFRTSPAKKEIQIGKSFTIKVVPEDDSEWCELTKTEWKEICKQNIDLVTFRSTNNRVATVNRKTGKVKGRKKGTANIKTFIYLANGETAIYKTIVYVK